MSGGLDVDPVSIRFIQSVNKAAKQLAFGDYKSLLPWQPADPFLNRWLVTLIQSSVIDDRFAVLVSRVDAADAEASQFLQLACGCLNGVHIHHIPRQAVERWACELLNECRI